jgi:hypothetical protein
MLDYKPFSFVEIEEGAAGACDRNQFLRAAPS